MRFPRLRLPPPIILLVGIALILGWCKAICGCSTLPHDARPLTDAEREDTHDGVRLWRASGLPNPTGCPLGQVYVHIAHPQEMWVCGRRGCKGTWDSKCLWGCMVYSSHGLPDFDSAAVLHINKKSPDLDRIRRHETLHWLAGCALSNPDPGHQTDAVWEVVLPLWDGLGSDATKQAEFGYDDLDAGQDAD